LSTDDASSGPPPAAFTGRRRNLKTPRSVRLAELVARVAVHAGGFGAIAAVLVVCGVLVAAVLPLFRGAEISAEGLAAAPAAEAPLHFAVDEYRALAVTVSRTGALDVFRLDDGARLESRALFEGPAPVSASTGLRDGRLGFGFADGSLRFCDVTFEAELADPATLPPALAALPKGGRGTDGASVVVHLGDDTWRRTKVKVALEEPLVGANRAAPVLFDEALSPSKRALLVHRADGSLTFNVVRERTNLVTGAVRRTLEESAIAYRAPAGAGAPFRMALAGLGDGAVLLWRDGRCLRYDLREPSSASVAESLDLVPDAGDELTDASLLIGGTTLVVSTKLGRSSAWFRTKPPGASTSDGAVLREAHVLAAHAAAVTASSRSARSRLYATGHADGAVRIHHVTSNALAAEARVPDGGPVLALRLAPKNDAVVALTRSGFAKFGLDAEMTEASPAALFTKIWYEGYEGPEHVWQSSSGTDDFEPKYGLWPLVFGTLKGTIIALLLAVPVALLAAIYTSEFLKPAQKARVKPVVEMMASLPSVVLGFVAALVLAPLVEGSVAGVVASFYVLPCSLLVGAYVWQSLPERFTRGASGFVKLCGAGLMLALGLPASGVVGRALELLLFEGDLKRWLDGQVGGPFGGWFVATLAPAAVGVALVFARTVSPAIRARSTDWSRGRAAAVDAAKFAAGVAATCLVAAVVAWALGAAGFDPRGALVGTYVQRNALVVGFVMGFAVIPIVYTIAEDALSSVPDSLRSASLGAGATPWQTATRIVVPTAMSGLFSAVMVGLGRAVGETMIVLMAAGNTPVMDWNVFNGFRTLSANIAVELPEAVQGGPHYRVLFLAALVLFAATFVLNTLAEVVRRRFRKRAYQL
jgi:phosphate transport system permease protein